MLIQSTASLCFQTVVAVNQGTKGYLRYRRLLAYHMTHSVTTRLLHMPGRKRARDASIQVTSKNRRIRRTPTTVGKLLTAISKSLLFLDAVPKILAMAASDVMALYFFSQAPCFRQVGRGPLLLRCSCRHTTSEIHACYGRSATIARTTRQTELPQPSRYWAHAWSDRRLAHKHLARLTPRGTPGFIQEPHR